ncbi:hypothetical protein J1614_002923 [Plenodomus biglobosus]|nr:hypothetical protein J1614_002923 [Plenodomus biglobosus]
MASSPPKDAINNSELDREEDIVSRRARKTWHPCTTKGEAFLRAMHSSDAEAGRIFKPGRATAASQFTDVAELAKWSWQDMPPDTFECMLGPMWDMPDLFEALGVSVKEPLQENDPKEKTDDYVQIIAVWHRNRRAIDKTYLLHYEVAGQRFHTTGAVYVFGIHSSGVLITIDRQSPQHSGARQFPQVSGTDLPALQSFSDVAWLKWLETFGTEPTTMRYFLTLTITNTTTASVFEKAIREAGPDFNPEWPGYDVAANTDSGAALLGSPNAVAFSYFLIQHKAHLGNLRIHKITLFQDRPGCDAYGNILFHVEPVPKEDELLGA